MPTATSTQARLLEAALALFQLQGISETTTKQIAERAGVNEATLFRQFGNKQGLVLALLQDTQLFVQLGQWLTATSVSAATGVAEDDPCLRQAVQDYSDRYLGAIAQVPELVRSLIGSAGQFSPEHRQALTQGLVVLNQATAAYLVPYFPPETDQPVVAASLLNLLLLGYGILELAKGPPMPQLAQDAAAPGTDWVTQQAAQQRAHWLHQVATAWENLQAFLVPGLPLQPQLPAASVRQAVGADLGADPTGADPQGDRLPGEDLPAGLVHDILQSARKRGLQDYAIAYTLFAAGLTAPDVVALQRHQVLSDRDQLILQLSPPAQADSHRSAFSPRLRQVPLNQWILGKRYGSPPKNPLTQWLRQRKDQHTALFLSPEQQPWTLTSLELWWNQLTADLLTPQGRSPSLQQIQPTWCVDWLLRGMTPENLAILTGLSLTELQPYRQRAQQKMALEQAAKLDQKP